MDFKKLYNRFFFFKNTKKRIQKFLHICFDINGIYCSNHLHHVVIWNDSDTFTIQHQNEHQVIFSFNQLIQRYQCNPYFSSNCEIQKSASINIIVTIVFFLICWTPYQYSLGQKVIKPQLLDNLTCKVTGCKLQ